MHSTVMYQLIQTPYFDHLHQLHFYETEIPLYVSLLVVR